MISCQECGRANPEQATSCSGCGRAVGPRGTSTSRLDPRAAEARPQNEPWRLNAASDAARRDPSLPPVQHYLVPPMGIPLRLPARTKPYAIGRDDTCDIVIAAARVSRRHCELVVHETRNVVVRDLGARNGTYVNGVAVAGEAPLEDGCVLALGDVTAVYRRLAPGEALDALAAPGTRDQTTPPLLGRPSLTEGITGDLSLYPASQLLLNLTKMQANGVLVIEEGERTHRLAFRNGNASDRGLFESLSELRRGKFRFEPAPGAATRGR